MPSYDLCGNISNLSCSARPAAVSLAYSVMGKLKRYPKEENDDQQRQPVQALKTSTTTTELTKLVNWLCGPHMRSSAVGNGKHELEHQLRSPKPRFVWHSRLTVCILNCSAARNSRNRFANCLTA